MEKYELRIVSSTKDLLREKRRVSNRSAVLIGNPKFDLEEAQQRAVVARFLPKGNESAPLEAGVGSDLRSRDLRGDVLPPLPGTKVELESIQSLLQRHGWQVEMYTEEKAAEEATKNVKSPRLLHVATHGFFCPTRRKLGVRKLPICDRAWKTPSCGRGCISPAPSAPWRAILQLRIWRTGS
jgi:CHAT domain-containing protein